MPFRCRERPDGHGHGMLEDRLPAVVGARDRETNKVACNLRAMCGRVETVNQSADCKVTK